MRSRVDEERQGLEEELARVGAELAEVEAHLPADFKTEYTRMVKAKGEDALAPLGTDDDGSHCGGCFQRVTTQVVNELRMERLIFCKSCGRLLYLPENG